MKVYKLIL